MEGLLWFIIFTLGMIIYNQNVLYKSLSNSLIEIEKRLGIRE